MHTKRCLRVSDCIDRDSAKTISPNLAMLFVSGAEDPVGEAGRR